MIVTFRAVCSAGMDPNAGCVTQLLLFAGDSEQQGAEQKKREKGQQTAGEHSKKQHAIEAGQDQHYSKVQVTVQAKGPKSWRTPQTGGWLRSEPGRRDEARHSVITGATETQAGWRTVVEMNMTEDEWGDSGSRVSCGWRWSDYRLTATG